MFLSRYTNTFIYFIIFIEFEIAFDNKTCLYIQMRWKKSSFFQNHERPLNLLLLLLLHYWSRKNVKIVKVEAHPIPLYSLFDNARG